MSGQGHWILILCLSLTRSYVDCKNVVFLPALITSHTRIQAFVAEELAKMNHSVWVGLPSSLEKINAESYPGVNIFSYSKFCGSSEDAMISRLEDTIDRAVISGTEPDWNWIWTYEDTLSEIYMKAMQEMGFTEYIESLKPDLIVLDWYPRTDNRVAVPYKLKVPFAVLSPLYDLVSGRVPYNSAAEAYNSPYFRNHASFYEKVQTVINSMSPLFQYVYNDRGYMKRLFPTDPDVPTTNELFSQAEVYLAETDPVLDYPRPALPNVKFVGGLSVSPAKELKEPFKSFVERSQKAGVGVAVLSFGTLIMNLPKETEMKIVSALRQLKLNTIWRANFTSPDPDKILTSTWIPQNDLLGNKNVKVFLSHMGLHSYYETLYHGVPVVCLPVFFDQAYNSDRAEDKGYCRQLNFLKASSDEFVKVIEEVASSKEMRSTIGTSSEIYRQLYKNPRQEAAFWLDHVMKYGGSYMRYSGQKIPMYLFIMDYVIVFLAGVVFTTGLVIVVVLLTRVFKFCFRGKQHVKKD